MLLFSHAPLLEPSRKSEVIPDLSADGFTSPILYGQIKQFHCPLNPSQRSQLPLHFSYSVLQFKLSIFIVYVLVFNLMLLENFL
jgi:hypothetical protein